MEAGSGAEKPVPFKMVREVSKRISIPLIVSGGIHSEKVSSKLVESGADIIGMGTFLEESILKDKGKALSKIISAIKASGKKKIGKA